MSNGWGGVKEIAWHDVIVPDFDQTAARLAALDDLGQRVVLVRAVHALELGTVRPHC